ncbi:MAG: PQQ-binding-like beta-propeller repeat protein [Gimesia chilikensis]|uniref:outer membrane protein assembly factor BamB family protein n=1 Tax=Gimesia chilikensis TaxID=2605989 RepID=UPI0037961CD9
MSTNPEDLAEASESMMEAESTDQQTKRDSLRWWPALFIVIVMLILRLLPMFFESPPLPVMMLGLMGPSVAGLLLLPWWLFASRAAIREKLIGLAGLFFIGGMAVMFDHSSIIGMPIMMYQLPVGMAAFALPLILLSRRSSYRLRAALLGALLGFGVWDLMRFDGVTGEFGAEFSYRWAPTSEDEYLKSLATTEESNTGESPDAGQYQTINTENALWPEFKGRNRNNVISGVSLETDWDQHPPRLIWKTLVGPGWSSFSVADNRLFTQEQRGKSEAILCLDAGSGDIVWVNEYPGRFWESIGGAGPRATPTIGDDALYCAGADGTVVCLEPNTGKLIWKRNLRTDADRKPPMWGWSSSPLVVDSKVIVYAGGDNDKGVIAYDASTGDIVWSVASGDHSYSSPQLAEIHGVQGILMVSNEGLQFLDLQDGHTIWNHAWKTETHRVLQPLVNGNSVLFAGNMSDGTRRVSVSRLGDEWQVLEDWTSHSMRPQYNDFVLYEGHVYGFDFSIFASINLETGTKNWKRGRYGNGQVLLLEDEGQLLVTSETGEIVLLKASPEGLNELARFPAIEGKTWNHPVLIGDRLYLRNGEVAACYQMPMKSRKE